MATISPKELRRMFKQAHEQGVQEGRQRERSELGPLIDKVREDIAEAERSVGREQGKAEGRAEMLAENLEALENLKRALMEERAQSYREGVVVMFTESGPVPTSQTFCGSMSPRTRVPCGREPGHPLGLYDRHKYVFADEDGLPHEAVVWNDNDVEGR